VNGAAPAVDPVVVAPGAVPATGPVPGRWRAWSRHVTNLALTAVTVCFVAAAWPASFGGCSALTIVAGESMEPALSRGDLAATWCAQPEVGDVVVFRVPAGEPGEGRLVIHRIVDGDGTTGWVTRGDNSERVDM
jgi:signal peptidase